ncbi:armadillo-like helical domain containing protein 1 [Octopus vulgaris]|uniref:Armadillo-like helical domain containing protein 1 n=1 Tax=Octopus vulgaris TaxID=6645 RepID=A0AA36B4M7_OCTVU|nr:armadillo-like helical domain containing protein 1 [Octopus vulgaris]
MRPAKEEAQINRVFDLFKEWDKGDEATRKKILTCFIQQNKNKTGPELEMQFAEGASLMLARISAWLRLSYLFGTALTEQLESINIFLSASCGHLFMTEFIEIGGIFTLIAILRLSQLSNNHKTNAVICLQSISNAGRKYKELICESYGLAAIAECLAKSQNSETQESCQQLLLSLFHANPKYQLQLYKTLIALLPCTSPKAQQIAVNSLRLVQPVINTTLPTLVEPLLTLLKTLHLEVQYEVTNYIKELIGSKLTNQILTGLINLLCPEATWLAIPDSITDPMKSSLSVTTPSHIHIQQAASAKTIRIVVEDNDEVAKKLIDLGVIQKLLNGVGNPGSADCQRHCSLALQYFAKTFPEEAVKIKDVLGDELYNVLMSSPNILYQNLCVSEVETLENIRGNIHIMERKEKEQ